MKSDTQLHKDVVAELKWQPAVHATDLKVDVKNGEVTLAGQVDSYLEQFEIERVVERVAGVKALTDNLEVKLPAQATRDDADIARAVGLALEWMAPDARVDEATGHAEGKVTVSVKDGWVTLSGRVDWYYQKVAAAAHIRHVMGVTGVTNDIVILPRAPLRALQGEIEAALARCAQVEARMIWVSVNGSDVTLGGSVETWVERDAACETAWATPGVLNVIDRMHSAY